mmetsp:Transcript_8774/g.19660  ORF Transcript_8774/g.19660 Transcript_8774/m.19660 type:complete len:200 (-) Transcript_8774:51-650(-)
MTATAVRSTAPRATRRRRTVRSRTAAPTAAAGHATSPPALAILLPLLLSPITIFASLDLFRFLLLPNLRPFQLARRLFDYFMLFLLFHFLGMLELAIECLSLLMLFCGNAKGVAETIIALVLEEGLCLGIFTTLASMLFPVSSIVSIVVIIPATPFVGRGVVPPSLLLSRWPLITYLVSFMLLLAVDVTRLLLLAILCD